MSVPAICQGPVVRYDLVAGRKTLYPYTSGRFKDLQATYGTDIRSDCGRLDDPMLS
jgi:hypothetical protein